MRLFKIVFVLMMAIGLTACSTSKIKSYNGPNVTRIEVHKANRKMYLLHGRKLLKEYDIALGQTPVGHKQFEGDSKTPEGTYYIDRVNPNSRYHLSVGISYPNPQDRAFARAQGRSPGGDIFIHGENGFAKGAPRDWTEGCIAVTDKEVEEIFAMVKLRTPIVIYP